MVKNSALIVSLVTLAGSSSLLAQVAAPTTPVPAGGPRAQFSETSFDFGRLKPTDTGRHDFYVTNTGNAVLEITDVKPGCGCTTAGTWDRQVKPGEAGRIPIQFNPANFTGPVSKSVTVTCNDPTKPTQYLQIQANVWRPIEVQPAYLHFISVEGETTNEIKVVRIVNNLDEPLTLEPPQCPNPAFKMELKPVKPGKEFELHVRYDGTVSNSNPSGAISIKTSTTNMPSLSVSAYHMPQPAVVIYPSRIHLPAGPVGTNYKAMATARINSKSAVQLSEPAVNIEGATVQMQEAQGGKVFSLSVSLPAGFQLTAGKTAELTVKTTHPKYPVLRVPIAQLPPPATTPVVQGPLPPPPVPVPPPAPGGK